MPSGSPPITRDEVPNDQRRRILQAVGELVAKRGYQGTTIELIVRKARVGYATFYKNFANKEECFLTFFDGAAALTAKRMNAAFEAADGGWPEQITAALGAFFELVSEQPVMARACLVESLTAGPTAVARYEMVMRSFTPLIRPGRDLNPREAELPETLEDTVVGGVVWIAYQRLIVGEADRLLSLLPETAEFVLGHYIGEEEAVRVVTTATAPAATQPA